MSAFAAISSFFKFSNISVYLIIGTVLVYGFFRIESLKSENENLENQVSTALEANEGLERRMVNFENEVVQNLNEQRRISARVEESNRRNRQRMDDLYDTFNVSGDGSERNLEELSKAKPGLIERRINDATAEVFENVEKNSTIERNSSSIDSN